ncbi:MAG: hypothetical protein KIT40_08980 [Nitrospira sp.]|nr:hypothetical protein [Nitrospira sp.]
MKHQKDYGVRTKIVVTVGGSAEENTVVLYRGGKNGLAFRSPSHRVLKDTARQRSLGEAASSGAQASAAMTSQHGGAR